MIPQNCDLKYLVHRYKYDTQLLNKLINGKDRDKYKEELIKKRIERHKQNIVDYVVNDYFDEFEREEDRKCKNQ